jgi:hypothetical protein
MLRPTIRASPTAMAQLSSTTADRHIRDQAQTPVANYCFSSSKKEQAPASRLRRLARTVADPTAQMDDHREPRSAVGGLLPSWPRHSGRRDSFGHGPVAARRPDGGQAVGSWIAVNSTREAGRRAATCWRCCVNAEGQRDSRPRFRCPGRDTRRHPVLRGTRRSLESV